MNRNAVIVLVEALERRSFSVNPLLRAAIEIAQILGLQIFAVPQFEEDGIVLQALPRQSPPKWAVWLGSSRVPDRYSMIYEHALGKQIYLLNTPRQHSLVQTFDRVYSALKDLMPPSVIVTQVADGAIAAAHLGFPISVRTLQPSDQGVEWAIASNWQELQRFVQLFLSESAHSTLLLQHVRLRHTRYAANGFPLGRQYQVVLHQQTLVTYGYRWAGDDSLLFLDTDEEAAMMQVAYEAAERLRVPLVAIDVAQQENGQWVVVGTGDLRWSELGQMPLIQLWNEISKISLSNPLIS